MSRCSTPIFESEIIDRFSKITAQTYQKEYLSKNLTKGYFLNKFCLLWLHAVIYRHTNKYKFPIFIKVSKYLRQ